MHYEKKLAVSKTEVQSIALYVKVFLENPVEATTIVQNFVFVFVENVVWKKNNIRNSNIDIKKGRKKKRLMRPLYIEPVTSLDKCRVTFYWVIKCTIWLLGYLVPSVGDFLRVLRFFHRKKNWPPRYNWNVVESGVCNCLHVWNKILIISIRY